MGAHVAVLHPMLGVGAAWSQVWDWRPHPEVWLLVVSFIAMGVWVDHTLEPKAVRAGATPITRAQRRWFFVSALVLWVMSDWPVHDIGEDWLYSVHMAQHLTVVFVFPPALLLATPGWLMRLLLGEGAVKRTFYRVARPLPAAIFYNVLVMFTHWARVVNTSVTSAPLHYLLHTLLVVSALLVWIPVVSPLEDQRISPPGRMIHLFLLSIVPTVPGAWMTAAEGVMYRHYVEPARRLGISATSDQQLAGVIMKVGGGLYLWLIIGVMFFKWMGRDDASEFRGRLVPTVQIPEAERSGESSGGFTMSEVERPVQAGAERPVQAGADRA